MTKEFTLLDYVIFVAYGLIIVGIGLWVSRKKKGETISAEDYFLANRDLPWWAVGTTLVASNISAEHFIGMSGSGYAIGLGIAAYEWIAAICLVLVGKYFLPIYLKKGIYTMPQFLEQRFNRNIATIIAASWLVIYMFVALPAVLYMGGLAIAENFDIPGLNEYSELVFGIVALALFSAIYSIYGGFTAVAWTDVIQVVLLVVGGLVATYMGLQAVSDGAGFLGGLKTLYSKAPDKFDLILDPDNPNYKYLPGLAVLVGSMWVTNLGYWGLNQYIIQRGLSAKDIKQAQYGVIFAGYLKLIIPLIVVIPGITAFVLQADIPTPDKAYPWLLRNFVPTGIKGLAFAALIAAVAASLSAMINSTSTIFTIDIYKSYINKAANNQQIVRMGRIGAFVALIVAIIVGCIVLPNFEQAFQYIQEFNGFIYPGVLVVFMIGLFWKQASTKAALACAIATPILGVGFWLFWEEEPFMDRMGWVFIILTAMAIVISLFDKENKVANDPVDEKVARNKLFLGLLLIIASIVLAVVNYANIGLKAFYVMSTGLFFIGMIQILNTRMKTKEKQALTLEKGLFKTDWIFTVGSIGIIAILVALYYYLG